MIIRHATQIGDPTIRRRSKPISKIVSSATKKIVQNLIDSMRYHELVGMAAPQIGINQRIFITEIRKTKARKPKDSDPVRIFINPRIIRCSKKQVFGYEACGSVAYAGIFGSVKRSCEITVEAYDTKGKKFKLYAVGLLARIIQHENDHLEGKVFLDRMADMHSLKSREEYLKSR